MPRANELGPGVVLDDTYRVVEKLGEGGMGAVYVAELVRLPKRVALKVLHVAADEAAKARFRREAEIAAKVRHPRIVEVLDYNFLEDGSPYLVMELLEGADLRHRMAAGPLEPGEALPILRDVASALERLHAEGIVHRDLKPENVFLAAEGDEIRAKVLDFGISKVVGAGTALTAEQSVLGTPAYMAPEQVTGENHALDSRTDQFALAAVAYEMLAGRPAFQGEHVMQLFHQILSAPAPALRSDEAESPADAVLARALHKEREGRFPSVGEFVRALAAALEVELRASAVDVHGATVAAPALSRETVAEPSPRDAARGRSRWLLPLASLAALGVVAGLGALALSSREEANLAEVAAAAEAVSAIEEAAAEDTSVDHDEDEGDAAEGSPREPDEREAGEEAPRAEEAPGGPSAEPAPDREAPSPEEKPAGGAPAAAERNEAKPTGPGRGAGRAKGSDARPEDADALARLERAEAALQAGNPDAAARHARGSMGKEPSDAARAVLVKAACEKRDLGLAKAMARGLRGASLREAKRYCAARDVKI